SVARASAGRTGRGPGCGRRRTLSTAVRASGPTSHATRSRVHAIPARCAGGPRPEHRRRSGGTGARQGSGHQAAATTAQEGTTMAVVTMRQLLESGVHFGHQTRRWNPKMKRFIFTERNGIYIIDLQQSLTYIDRAYDFVKETVA